MNAITDLTVHDIQERMGAEATELEARCMLAILSRECITDTDDVSEGQWLEWSSAAMAEAAREA